MLNRKVKASTGANQNRGHQASKKPVRRRFIISPRAVAAQPPSPPSPPARRGRPPKNANAHQANGHATASAKPELAAGATATPGAPAGPGQAADLTEAIKTLLHLAHENG